MGTDRWNEEQELIKLYGLTPQEATVFIADKYLKREDLSEYLGIERQTIKNILTSANRKMRKPNGMQICIVRPSDKSRGTQCATEILAKFYSLTTGVNGWFPQDVIYFGNNDKEQVGDSVWMDSHVFRTITITDAVTHVDIDNRVNKLMDLYKATNSDGKMGWGVLKKKLDSLYVRINIE